MAFKKKETKTAKATPAPAPPPPAPKPEPKVKKEVLTDRELKRLAEVEKYLRDVSRASENTAYKLKVRDMADFLFHLRLKHD